MKIWNAHLIFSVAVYVAPVVQNCWTGSIIQSQEEASDRILKGGRKWQHIKDGTLMLISSKLISAESTRFSSTPLSCSCVWKRETAYNCQFVNRCCASLWIFVICVDAANGSTVLWVDSLVIPTTSWGVFLRREWESTVHVRFMKKKRWIIDEVEVLFPGLFFCNPVRTASS